MKRLSITSVFVLLGLFLTFGVATASVLNFRAHLSGNFEIPMVVDTQAQGEATFQVNGDGSSVHFRLIAANIDNVFMAHIHVNPPAGSPPGTNGPIVVWLYPQTPFAPSQTVPPASWIQGRFDGVLSEGDFTAADLKGPLAGHSLADLVTLLGESGVYVNIHTNDFVPPINTGPGDFFPGEIHGPTH